MTMTPNRRRALLTVATGIAALTAPRLVMAQSVPAQTVPAQAIPAEPVPAYPRHNSSGFQMQDWRDHFDSLGSGVIVADFASRALHYWSGDGTDYRLYPTSVPLTEELTKRGYTEVVRKRVGPDWTPTANMRARDPSLPAYLPPGKDNPLGTHAMYLTWPAYLIHGTHDTRKIGRPSSSGCVGLYNEHIEQLFNVVPVGTRVRII